MRRAWRIAAALGGLTAALVAKPPQALADLGEPIENDTGWSLELHGSAPHPLAPTVLVLERQRMRFDCAGSTAARSGCAQELEWALWNPTAEAAETTLEWTGLVPFTYLADGASWPDVEVDGRMVQPRDGASWTRSVSLRLAPGQRMLVRWRGYYAFGSLRGGGMLPTEFLHFLVGGSYVERRSLSVSYHTGRPRAGRKEASPWAQLGDVIVEARVPRGWPTAPELAADGVAMTRTRDGAHADLVVRRCPSESICLLAFSWRPRPTSGGPFVGVGGALGAGGGFRLRAGWEQSLTMHSLVALSADTDARSRLRLALTASGVQLGAYDNPRWIELGIAVGAGVVTDVLPRARPGARMVWTVFSLLVGFEFSLDVFPGDRTVQATLLARGHL